MKDKEKAEKFDLRSTVDKLRDMGFDPLKEMVETYQKSKQFNVTDIENPIELLKFRAQTAKDIQNLAYKEEELRIKKNEANKDRTSGNISFSFPTMQTKEITTTDGKKITVPVEVNQIEKNS